MKKKNIENPFFKLNRFELNLMLGEEPNDLLSNYLKDKAQEKYRKENPVIEKGSKEYERK